MAHLLYMSLSSSNNELQKDILEVQMVNWSTFVATIQFYVAH